MKTVFPTAKRFTVEPIRSWKEERVIYKTSDDAMALHFNKDGRWEISQLQNGHVNSTTKKFARTNEYKQGPTCPIEVEKWQYWSSTSAKWVDAGPRIQLKGLISKFYIFPRLDIRVYFNQRQVYSCSIEKKLEFSNSARTGELIPFLTKFPQTRFQLVLDNE